MHLCHAFNKAVLTQPCLDHRPEPKASTIEHEESRQRVDGIRKEDCQEVLSKVGKASVGDVSQLDEEAQQKEYFDEIWDFLVAEHPSAPTDLVARAANVMFLQDDFETARSIRRDYHPMTRNID